MQEGPGQRPDLAEADARGQAVDAQRLIDGVDDDLVLGQVQIALPDLAVDAIGLDLEVLGVEHEHGPAVEGHPNLRTPLLGVDFHDGIHELGALIQTSLAWKVWIRGSKWTADQAGAPPAAGAAPPADSWDGDSLDADSLDADSLDAGFGAAFLEAFFAGSLASPLAPSFADDFFDVDFLAADFLAGFAAGAEVTSAACPSASLSSSAAAAAAPFTTSAVSAAAAWAALAAVEAAAVVTSAASLTAAPALAAAALTASATAGGTIGVE